MAAALGTRWAKLVDNYDQDHAMVLGQGATAGLFQSVMLRPLNVANVYPLGKPLEIVELPAEWTKNVVVFHAESQKTNDVMALK